MDPQLVESFTSAARDGNISKVVDMLESSNEYGNTALMLAAVFNRTEVVHCLLEKGVNVN